MSSASSRSSVPAATQVMGVVSPILYWSPSSGASYFTPATVKKKSEVSNTSENGDGSVGVIRTKPRTLGVCGQYGGDSPSPRFTAPPPGPRMFSQFTPPS